MEKKTLNVEGMSCEHCVRSVTNAVSSIAGIADVVVSLKNKTVSFNYNPAIARMEDVIAAIESEGYSV